MDILRDIQWFCRRQSLTGPYITGDRRFWLYHISPQAIETRKRSFKKIHPQLSKHGSIAEAFQSDYPIAILSSSMRRDLQLSDDDISKLTERHKITQGMFFEFGLPGFPAVAVMVSIFALILPLIPQELFDYIGMENKSYTRLITTIGFVAAFTIFEHPLGYAAEFK